MVFIGNMSAESNDLLSVMRARISDLKREGDWEGALSAAETLVGSTRDTYEFEPETLLNYISALEILANIYRDTGNQKKAQTEYTKVIDLLENHKGFYDRIGIAAANVASIMYDQEMVDEAKEYFKWSLENLEVADPPAPLEIAGVLNNLAFLYEEEQRYDEAESLFMRALKINSEQLGMNDVATADVCNNLGGLFYKNGKYDQAIEMHKLALTVRQDMLGEVDSDTAQSWGNLAIVHAANDNFEEAKECFEQALDILEKNPKSKLNDYATVNANFVLILRQSGHKDGIHILESSTKPLLL